MHIFSLALKIRFPCCGIIDDRRPFDASQISSKTPPPAAQSCGVSCSQQGSNGLSERSYVCLFIV